MSLHKKTHRVLLVISFIYLTFCPVPRVVYADVFNQIDNAFTIHTCEGRHHRGHTVLFDTQLHYFSALSGCPMPDGSLQPVITSRLTTDTDQNPVTHLISTTHLLL